VTERGAVVADDLGVAGDKPPVGRERERIDLEQLQVLDACDLRQARGIAGEARGEVGRKQPDELGIECVGADIPGPAERDPYQRLGAGCCELWCNRSRFTCKRTKEKFERLKSGLFASCRSLGA
jgi:hypothetical protein